MDRRIHIIDCELRGLKIKLVTPPFLPQWHDTHVESERIPIGVDKLVLHAFLPEDSHAQQQIETQFPFQAQWSKRRKHFLVGSHSQQSFVFVLSHFPGNSGYDLKIQFNPSTCIHGHNLQAADAQTVQKSLQLLQQTLDALNLRLNVLSLRMVEVHLTRDVVLYCNNPDWNTERKAEEFEVQELLRFLSWSLPSHTRQARNYNNARKRNKTMPLLEEGFKRGNKSREWTIYDKTLHVVQNSTADAPCGGYALPSKDKEQEYCNLFSPGRITRIEWKLKDKEQIQKRLTFAGPQGTRTIKTCGQLLELLFHSQNRKEDPFYASESIGIEECFDQELKTAYFKLYKPYDRQLPRIPQAFLTEIKGRFVGAQQQELYERLQGAIIRRGDIEPFLRILDKMGADKVRTHLRRTYHMDSFPTVSERKSYDKARETLMRLRQHAPFSSTRSYLEMREQVLQWICYSS